MTDYLPQGGVWAEERQVRADVTHMHRDLQIGELRLRRWRAWAVLQVPIEVGHLVWLVMDPRTMTGIALLVWTIAITFTLAVALPGQTQVVKARRDTLRERLELYDRVFARMLAAEES